jgi:hypothetical protein
MDPKRQSITEANAYRTLRVVLADFHRAERTLSDIEHAAPDPERPGHLATLRPLLGQLEAFLRNLPQR